MSTILGIDYSYTCPAVCVLRDGSSPHWYVNYKKTGKPYPDMPMIDWAISIASSEVMRYIELAEWVVTIARREQPDVIILEDYAFGANGRLTQLSENAGTLKVKLFEHLPHIPLRVVAPTTMKKFATGRGIATKDDVWMAFTERMPEAKPWPTCCHPKATHISSPLSDIADSYFLAYYGYTHCQTPETTQENVR